MAAGMLTFEELKREIAADTIDTVIAAMVDLQGRLVGKRFHAEYFADSGHEETHGCNYLLGVDIEMEPVPGYKAASWELGYGDFTLKPDMATLRRVPWLPGTALVICDVVDHHHEDVPHSPRAMLKKQLGRLEAMKLKAYVASELEFFLFDDSYESAHQKGYRNLKTAGHYIEDYHILQTTKDEVVMRALRNGLQGAGIPVENSKGEWGPGQEEINVGYAEALEMADRHAIIKNGAKEIAYGLGKAITFMAKWDYGMAGSSCPRPPVAVVQGRQVAALLRRGGRPRHVGDDEAVPRRPTGARRARSPISWRPTSIPTSASWRAPLPRRARSGASTIGRRATGCAAPVPRPSASNAASAARTSIPTWPSRH